MSAVTSSSALPSKSKPGALKKPKALSAIRLAGTILIAFLLPTFACAQANESVLPGAKPPDIPNAWRSWMGEYEFCPNPNLCDLPGQTIYILSERDGLAWISERQGMAKDAPYKDLERFPLTSSPWKASLSKFRIDSTYDGTHELVGGDVGFVMRDRS